MPVQDTRHFSQIKKFPVIGSDPPVGNLLCYLHYFAMIYCNALTDTALKSIELNINVLHCTALPELYGTIHQSTKLLCNALT